MRRISYLSTISLPTVTAGVVAVGLLVPAGSALAVDSVDSGEVFAEHQRAQKHSVTLRGPAKSVVSGTRFKVSGTVVGAKPKKATVKLQRKKTKNAKKTWVTVAKTKTKTTKKQSRYSKKLMFTKASRVKLRAVVAQSSRYCSSTQQRQCGPKRIASAPVRVTFAAPAAAPSQPDAPSVPAPATPPADVSAPPVSAPGYPGTVVDCDNGAAVGDAVAAAADGDTLNISGTCQESDIVIDRNLTLTGNGTIDAQQKGRVLFIDGVNVSITGDLTLTGGKVSGSYPDGYGGGIFNDAGILNLSGNARVIGNTADSGGGIGVRGYLTGFVNISDNASISGNSADSGGGVSNSCATVNLNGGSVSNNTAGSSGGIANGGSCSVLNINNGTIADNKATTGVGGGIGSFQGRVTLNGGSITQNTAATDGGGIYKSQLSLVNISGGSITGNSAGNNGGGIHNGDTYVDISGGSITGNSAGNNGGGIYNENSMVFGVAEVRGVFNGADAPDRTDQGSWNSPTGQSNSPDDIYSDVPTP